MGPADPRPRAPRRWSRRSSETAARRHHLRSARPSSRCELARGLAAAVPSIEMVRFVSLGHRSHDERRAAGPGGHRARDSCSSSSADTTATSTLCWRRPAPGWRPWRYPPAPGVPAAVTADTLLCEYNDLDGGPPAGRAPRRRPGLRDRRAGGRQHGRGARRSPGSSRGCATICNGTGALLVLGRGDHRLPGRLRRCAGAPGRPRRPHLPGQDRRRRAAGGGVRRSRPR